jgi:hypothetical protein
MTLSLNKTFLMILLIILFFLLAITGVYGGYHLILGQAGNKFSATYFSDPALLLLGCILFLIMLLPVFFALRFFIKHKKTSHH